MTFLDSILHVKTLLTHHTYLISCFTTFTHAVISIILCTISNLGRDDLFCMFGLDRRNKCLYKLMALMIELHIT